MTQVARRAAIPTRLLRGYRLPTCIAVASLIGVGVVSHHALVTNLIDFVSAMLVVGPFALGGLCLVQLLRLGKLPLRWHILLGCGLGLGVLSLLVLALGLLGLLNRPLWISLAVVSAVAGILRLRDLVACRVEDVCTATSSSPDTGNLRLLWLIVIPFITLSLLASANAPGLIWSEEGFGYDVLEYHLQLPKEYRQAGVIEYLPHNVYASFPAGVEMLYLVAMIILDADLEVGTTCNMIHLLLGGLAVFAAFVAGSQWSLRAGVLAAVALATTHWMSYLSGLSYVEHGMLFFGFASVAALIRATSSESGPDAPCVQVGKWYCIAGLMAGFACACKYTAVPMIALPVLLAIAAHGRSRAAERRTERNQLRDQSRQDKTQPKAWRGPGVGASVAFFVLGVTMAFGPWLVKNMLHTGNPVFPLGNSLFHASPEGWSDESDIRWSSGHTPAPHERRLTARLSAAWRMIPADHMQRFGPIILVLPMLGLAWRRWDRCDVALVLMLLLQILIWLFATHLYARFAVVMLIPLTLLTARTLIVCTPARAYTVISLLILGGVWNGVFAAGLHAAQSSPGAPPAIFYEGMAPGFEYYGYVNHELPPDARVLLVGDARALYYQKSVDYCVVFNQSAFVDAIRASAKPKDVASWLAQRGYTHVLVHWQEISRLRQSRYGFPEEIMPELFTTLCGDGLTVIKDFPHPARPSRYVTLYAVDTD